MVLYQFIKRHVNYEPWRPRICQLKDIAKVLEGMRLSSFCPGVFFSPQEFETGPIQGDLLRLSDHTHISWERLLSKEKSIDFDSSSYLFFSHKYKKKSVWDLNKATLLSAAVKEQ